MFQEKALEPILTVPAVSSIAAKRATRRHGHSFRTANLQIKLWFERWKQRRALARLDDRLLADIGVTRAQAAQEIKKWFWQS